MWLKIITLIGILIGLTSCDEDNNQPPLPPQVILGSTESEANRGDTVVIQITLSAEAGIKSLTQNGEVITGYEDTDFQTGYVSYIVKKDQANGNYPIKFVLTDRQDRVSENTYTIKVVDAIPKIQLYDGSKYVSNYAISTKRNVDVSIRFQWEAKEGVQTLSVVDEKGVEVKSFVPSQLNKKEIVWTYKPDKTDTRSRIELRHFVTDIKNQVSTPPAILFINLLPFTKPTIVYDGNANNIQFISNSQMLLKFNINADLSLNYKELRVYKNDQPYDVMNLESMNLQKPASLEYSFLVAESVGENLKLSFELVDDANQVSTKVNLTGVVN
ncbi:MAG: hypothetical protein OHK0038_19470 [Flammeovirgaceae bacterium]